jgi:hypothetical protein
MKPNSKPLLLNSRTSLGSARKTLAPIEPETIKNREVLMGGAVLSPTPAEMMDDIGRQTTMNSLQAGYSSLKETIPPR